MMQTQTVDLASLLKAAARRDLAAVNRLLAAGAEVDAVDPKASGPNGFTYLHLAALLNKTGIAARLLKRAQVSAPALRMAKRRCTSLSVACRNG